jgi:hypothetical protein
LINRGPRGCRPSIVSPTRCTQAAADGKANPQMARRQAAGPGGTGSRRWDPIRFSRIQIAWCAGCWPTSPRPPGSHLLFHATAADPPAAGPKVRYCHDLRPVTGSPGDADQAILQHPPDGAGIRHRRIARPRAAITARRRSPRSERSPPASSSVLAESRRVRISIHRGRASGRPILPRPGTFPASRWPGLIAVSGHDELHQPAICPVWEALMDQLWIR